MFGSTAVSSREFCVSVFLTSVNFTHTFSLLVDLIHMTSTFSQFTCRSHQLLSARPFSHSELVARSISLYEHTCLSLHVGLIGSDQHVQSYVRCKMSSRDMHDHMTVPPFAFRSHLCLCAPLCHECYSFVALWLKRHHQRCCHRVRTRSESELNKTSHAPGRALMGGSTRDKEDV